jgi:CRP/FNR family cyclic AMP-dependent transcriptional regulator
MTEQATSRRLSLFEGCSAAELDQITASGEEVEVEPGEIVVREGRFDHEFFVILAGTAAVLKAGAEVARLGPGEFFGETALLTGQARNASVEADGPMRLLVIPEERFHDLLDLVPAFAVTVRRGAEQRPTDLEPQQ